MNTRTLAFVGTVIAVCAAVAAAATFATVVVSGHRYHVRATNLGGEWYLNARDLAVALRGGASFDSSTRTFYAAATQTPRAAPSAVGRAKARPLHGLAPGSTWTTNGYVAARIVSLTRPETIREFPPDPGTHFVAALIEFKNKSHEPEAIYNADVEIMSGSTHINQGEFYEANYTDVAEAATSPGATHRYVIAFEVANDAAPDIILIHPHFGGGGPDLVLHI